MESNKKFSGKIALYFEDQLDTVEGIVYILEEILGVRVIQADSPEEALKCMAEYKFDLIVLDIRIIDGNQTREGEKQDWTRYGVYFLEELREGRLPGKTPANVPVLIITCVVSTPDVKAISELGRKSNGRYCYLPKPVDDEDDSAIEGAVAGLLSE